MKKILFVLTLGLILSTIISIHSSSIHADLSDNLIRLHIVANSDDSIDQEVKLKVRDRILKEMNVLFTSADSTEECKKIVEDNIDKIIWYANDELRINGFDYTADASLGIFEFPTKVYGNIMLPKGSYNAVRVVLGNGGGHNWWCVMFPPLCFVEESKGEIDQKGDMVLKNNLNQESYDVITNNGKLDLQVKFKIVEVFTK